MIDWNLADRNAMHKEIKRLQAIIDKLRAGLAGIRNHGHHGCSFCQRTIANTLEAAEAAKEG
jgi:hypothetical protein